MEILFDISPKKNSSFVCECCHYITGFSKDYKKHLLTAKHKILHNPTPIVLIPTPIVLNLKTYSCECGKKYKHSSTLYAHKKICLSTNNSNTIIKDHIEIHMEEYNEDHNDNKPTDKDDIIMTILKQTSDLIKEQSNIIKEQSDIKQIILEIVKNGINNNNNNNNTIHNNSHNKAFNLNFFLNDTCKNAMNITECVDSIKLELSDLMELGEIGYVAGMSKIITKNLNALDETIRPIHCTDTKRETFYVKDEDKWEKEDVETKKLKKLIFRLSNKTYKLMPKYREMYPDYDSSTSTHSDEYCKIIIEAMMCDPAKDDKIIRNISKITAIAGK